MERMLEKLYLTWYKVNNKTAKIFDNNFNIHLIFGSFLRCSSTFLDVLKIKNYVVAPQYHFRLHCHHVTIVRLIRDKENIKCCFDKVTFIDCTKKEMFLFFFHIYLFVVHVISFEHRIKNHNCHLLMINNLFYACNFGRKHSYLIKLKTN